MRRAVVLAVFAVSALALAPASWGAERGTPAEAKQMLSKAVDHYKAVGRKQALADFTAGKAPFRDRDLYVVCTAADHSIAANGGFPDFVGTSADALHDAKGNPIGKALWSAAAKNPSGSIEYPMLNPATRKLENKTTFYSQVSQDLLCGVGAYSVR